MNIKINTNKDRSVIAVEDGGYVTGSLHIPTEILRELGEAILLEADKNK